MVRSLVSSLYQLCIMLGFNCLYNVFILLRVSVQWKYTLQKTGGIVVFSTGLLFLLLGRGLLGGLEDGIFQSSIILRPYIKELEDQPGSPRLEEVLNGCSTSALSMYVNKPLICITLGLLYVTMVSEVKVVVYLYNRPITSA